MTTFEKMNPNPPKKASLILCITDEREACHLFDDPNQMLVTLSRNDFSMKRVHMFLASNVFQRIVFKVSSHDGLRNLVDIARRAAVISYSLEDNTKVKDVSEVLKLFHPVSDIQVAGLKGRTVNSICQ